MGNEEWLSIHCLRLHDYREINTQFMNRRLGVCHVTPGIANNA